MRRRDHEGVALVSDGGQARQPLRFPFTHRLIVGPVGIQHLVGSRIVGVRVIGVHRQVRPVIEAEGRGNRGIDPFDRAIGMIANGPEADANAEMRDIVFQAR